MAKVERSASSSMEQEISILPTTTLKEIGVEAKRDKVFQFSKEPLVVARLKDKSHGQSIYLSFVNHPFKGVHLNRLISDVAPLGDGNLFGVINDLIMPIRAHQLDSKIDSDRDETHKESSEISTPYVDFVRHNLPAWYTALRVDDTDGFFRIIEEVKFFSNADWFADWVEKRNKSKLLNYVWPVYLEEKQHAYIRYTKVGFLDDFTFEMNDFDGSRVEFSVSPDPSDSGIHEHQFSKYAFSDRAFNKAIFPLIAWRKSSDGQRRFLGQKEVEPMLERTPFLHAQQGDVYLGRSFVGYFAEELTSKWKKEIALTKPDGTKTRPQKIMGAQVPVWVSMDSDEYPHARQLLNHESSPIAKIEQFADSFSFARLASQGETLQG